MVTFFSVPKPFDDPIGAIQRNAIGSWLAAVPGAQVLLFGDEAGIAEAASDFGAEHHPALRRTSSGAPLLDEVFHRAHAVARHDVLCFVNTDIVLRGCAGPLVRLSSPFLVIAESMDLPVHHLIRYEAPTWREPLEGRGRSRGPFALDVFFFSRDLFRTIPPFAIGRARFDNWLVWHALHQRASVIDGTDVLQPLHQHHGYSHLLGGRREAYRGPDAWRNQVLAGLKCYLHLYSVLDARYRLTGNGLERLPWRPRFLAQLRRRLTGAVADGAARLTGAAVDELAGSGPVTPWR